MEIKKGDEEEAWILVLKKYFKVHDYSKNLKARIVIQVDIGGHPPIPLEPPPLLLSVFQFLHSLLFLAVFSGPELPGPF
jgi:hypothetical protein